MAFHRLRIFSTPVREHSFGLDFVHIPLWNWQDCDEEHERERKWRYEDIDCDGSLFLHDKEQILRPVYLSCLPATLVIEVDDKRLYEAPISLFPVHFDVHVPLHWSLHTCKEKTESEISWRATRMRMEDARVGLYVPAGYSHLSVYVECFDTKRKREHVENSSDCRSICSDTY